MAAEDDAREAIEVAHQIEELTRHPGWPYLLDFVRDRAIAKQNRMIQGNINTLDAYKLEAGWLQGSQYVFDAPRLARQVADEAQKHLPVETP